ncbi:hypothetical protein K501DRAFT_275880 [Backusella circina FSU 941]|nr:hypothetical protein K501DRAFT_275880 [Backusella circina FSU 941]
MFSWFYSLQRHCDFSSITEPEHKTLWSFYLQETKRKTFNSMKLFVFYLLPLLLCILSNHVHCSYPITIKDNSVPLLPYLFSASTIVYKDIIYSYGGTKYTQTQGTDKLFSYTLDQSTGEMVVKLENENQGPICAYCNAVLFPNSTEMLVFSEPNYNESSIFFHNQTMWQANQTVLPHFYDLEKKTWRVAPPTKKDGQDQTFYGRVYHSTVLNGNDGVYILGGLYHYLEFPNSESESSNMTANEPLSSDSNINRNLTDYNPNPTRNGSSYNPDPYYNSSSTNITGSTSDLLKRDVEHDTKDTVGYPLITDGWYYNRHDNSYTAISLPNNEPYVDPIAYIDIDGKLALLGGCNISSTAKYIKCYDISIINIYDNATKSWGNKQAKSNPSWSYGTIAGAATQVDYNRKLLYVSGGYFTYNSLIYTNGDFSILDLERDVWIYGYPEEKSEIQIPLSKASGALIMNNTYFVKLFGLRSNENIYTEAHTIDILDLRTSASLTSQTYVDQVQPINWITSTVEDNKNSFKNKALQYIGLICILIVAVIAVALFLYFKRRNLPIYWHELKKSLLWNPSTLNTSNVSSFYYIPHYSTDVATDENQNMLCYLYALAKPDIITESNSSISVTVTGTSLNSKESIFIQFYTKDQDFNRIIYNQEDMPGVSNSDLQDWSLTDTKSESQDMIPQNTYAIIEYQQINYEYIAEDRKWNYMVINHAESSSTDSGNSDTEANTYFNSITINPKSFQKQTITQKRDSTVLGIFESIGGVIGLIAGLQVILFGTRPSSPWGIFHYWTWTGKSALPDLEEQFCIPEAKIPFINPVHQRFNDVFKKNSDEECLIDTSPSSSTSLIDKENIEERVSRIEARNQLLELVMKNYYLDNQVFLALGNSQRASEEDAQQERNKSNNQESDQDDSDREPDYKKLSFLSKAPFTDPDLELLSNK